MAALTAAAAMATVTIEPEKRSRMMISFCLAACVTAADAAMSSGAMGTPVVIIRWTQSKRNAPGRSAGGGLAVSYWKVIMSVRLSVVAFGFKGSFAKFALPEFKTL